MAFRENSNRCNPTSVCQASLYLDSKLQCEVRLVWEKANFPCKVSKYRSIEQLCVFTESKFNNKSENLYHIIKYIFVKTVASQFLLISRGGHFAKHVL